MGDLIFTEEGHKYSKDGFEFISVTQLLEKHFLAPNFNLVDNTVLRLAREKGRAIHKEVEDYIKTNTKPSLYDESLATCKLLEENKKKLNYKSEMRICTPLDFRILIAGTIDIYCEDKKSKEVELIDIKSSKTFTNETKEYATWQLSLYSYILRLNNKNLKVRDIKVLYFDKEDKSKAILESLAPREDKEIEKLLDCEEMGLIYKSKDRLLPKEMLNENSIFLIKNIQEHQRCIKELEEQLKDVKNAIYNYMQKEHIDKLTSNDGSLTISKIAPSIRDGVDIKRLKEEQRGIFEEYKKETETKGYVRFNFKEII